MKKKKQDKQLIDSLELCKKHGGPITPNDIHLLDKLTDEQVLAEASYWKKIHGGGSCIRFRHKVGNQFVKFTIDEMRQQIRDVVQPVGEQIEVIDELLKTALAKHIQKELPVDANVHGGVEANDDEEDDEVGLLCWWNGPLDQTQVGVVMNQDSLQMFSLKRYGFVPDMLLVNKKDWTLEHLIENIIMKKLEAGYS